VDLKVLSGAVQIRSRGNVERLGLSNHPLADYSSVAGERVQTTEMSIVHRNRAQMDLAHISVSYHLCLVVDHRELKMLSALIGAIVVVLARLYPTLVTSLRQTHPSRSGSGLATHIGAKDLHFL
jgi:hypothetical protein